MATVSISKDLINDVSSAIARMRNAEFASEFGLGYEPEQIAEDCSGFVNAVMWEGKDHLIKDIPRNWLDKQQAVRLDLTFNNVAATITFKNLKSQFDRPRYNHYNRSKISADTLSAHLVRFPEMLPILETTFGNITKVRQFNERWTKVQDDVLDFLKGRKSLNEALKLMPNLALYIPKEYIERVERKVVRSSEPAAINISIDRINELAAAAIGAKLAGASV